MAKPDIDKCPFCGLKYDDFRTGYTYKDIFNTFWVASDDQRLWKHKGRHTVLGRWMQTKRELWRDHLSICEECSGQNSGSARIDVDYDVDPDEEF